MQYFSLQKNENAVGKGAVTRKKRFLPTLLALFSLTLLLLVGAFIFRMTILEAGLRQHCASRGLECSSQIERFSYRDLGVSTLSVSEDGRELFSVENVDLGLSWAQFFKPGVEIVLVDKIDLKIDLTGEGHPLESLMRLVDGGDGSSTGFPRAEVRQADITVETPAGPLFVSGSAVATGPDSFDFRYSAQPANLVLEDRQVSLEEANGWISRKGDDLGGELVVAISMVATPNLSAQDVALDVSLHNDEGPLKLLGTGQANDIQSTFLSGNKVDFTIDAEAGRIPENLQDWKAWWDVLEALKLDGVIDAGRFDHVSWNSFQLDLSLERSSASPTAALTGPVSIDGEGVLVSGNKDDVNPDEGPKLASIDQFSLNGTVSHELESKTGLSALDGVLNLRGADISQWSVVETVLDSTVNSAPSPARRLLGVLRSSLGKAAVSVDAETDLELRWFEEDGLWSAAIPEQIELHSQTGDRLTLGQADDQHLLMIGPGGSIRGGADIEARIGPLSLSGEGLIFETVSGTENSELSIEAKSAKLALADQLESLRLELDELDYKSATPASLFDVKRFGLLFSGRGYGAQWKDLQIQGALAGHENNAGWSLDATEGLAISFEHLETGDLVLGQTVLDYTPVGVLSERQSGESSGQGKLSAAQVDVTLAGRPIVLTFSEGDIDWTGGRRPHIDGQLDDVTIDLDFVGRPLELDFPMVDLDVDLGRGWDVGGSFGDGEGRYGIADLDQIAGRFGLRRGETNLEGDVADVSMRVSDRADSPRFAEMETNGRLQLRHGTFVGQATISPIAEDIALGEVVFRHSLRERGGEAVFRPSEIAFDPGTLQPASIFPLLRGLMANVRGIARVRGDAEWDRDGLDTSATMELVDIGFVSAQAGLFEGIFGRIELTDVIRVKSPPQQQIAISNWNPGLEMHTGEVEFQFDGLKTVQLHGSSWPFADGFLKAEPMLWDSEAESNDVVVKAEDISLQSLLEFFGIPKIEASGRLNGSFPISLGRSGAIIDDAELTAGEGHFGYVGDPPENFEDLDGNLKLMFEALRDFHFSELKLKLDGNLSGDMVTTMYMKGHNPAVLDGYPFELTMNLDADLMSLLNSGALGMREVERMTNAIVQDKR